MVRIGVIGIGNELRGDDAVGLVIARHLQLDIPAGVTVQEVHGEGTSLIDRWQDSDVVILVDASLSDSTPGTIQRLEPLTQPIPSGIFPCSTHVFGVSEAIELARALQQLPPELVVYGIEGEQFDIGSELSAKVLQAVPDAVEQIRQDIQVFQTRAKGSHYA